MEEKFTKNILMAEYFRATNSQSIVALRISRVNHACLPNAATIYDETGRVAILFAQKDIQPGEEITICYYSPFFWLIPDATNISLEEEFNIGKQHIALVYGITCSPNCFCYNPAIRALMEEGRQLYKTAKTFDIQLKVDEALAAGDKLLDIYRRLNLSWEYRGYTEFHLFQVSIQKSGTIPKAMEYIRSAIQLFGNICPYSERITKKFENMMQDPESLPHYLLIDKIIPNSF